MNALIALLAASIAINALLGFFLLRAARRVLEFDEVWQQAMPVLFEYAEDLRKMVSTDLLTDNPEVIKFHKRNLRVLTELDSITQAVRGVVKQQGSSSLPRPDVE